MLYLMSVFHNYETFYLKYVHCIRSPAIATMLHICCSIRPYFKPRGPSRSCPPFSPTCSTQNGGKAPHHRGVGNLLVIGLTEALWTLVRWTSVVEVSSKRWLRLKFGQLKWRGTPFTVDERSSITAPLATLWDEAYWIIEFFLAPVDHLIWGYYRWYLISQIHLVIHPSIKLHLAICPRVPLPVCVAPTVALSVDCLRSEAERSPPETHRSRAPGVVGLLHHPETSVVSMLAWRFDGSWFSPISSCMFRAFW